MWQDQFPPVKNDPPPKKEFRSYSQIGRILDNWGHEFEIGPNGIAKNLSSADLQLAAIFRLIAVAETASTLLRSMDAQLQAMRPEPSPKPPSPAPDPKALREATSRARAWAAYVAAGGTMLPEGDEVLPDLPDLRLHLEQTGLPNRVINALEIEGIQTLGELVERTARDLLYFRNFGGTSLRQVRAELTARGLALKGDSSPS